MIQYINTRYTIRYYMVQYNTVRYNVTFYDTTRYNTIRYDTIRYVTIRYDTNYQAFCYLSTVLHICVQVRVGITKLYPLTIYILVTTPSWYLVVCKRIILKWKGVFVACFCLCEFMCLSRDCMYLAFTRARVRMYERERERENEWEITAGKGRGGGETDFVTKIWRKKEGFLEDKIDWTTNETIIITAVSFWLKQFFQSYRLLFMEARFTDFHVMKNLHARICMYNNARIITRV